MRISEIAVVVSVFSSSVPVLAFSPSSYKDSFSGKMTHTMSHTGVKIDGPTVLSAPTLVFGCYEGRTQAFIALGIKNFASKAKTEIKIDGGSIVSRTLDMSTDYTAAGLANAPARSFAKLMTSGKEAAVRVTLKDGRFIVYKFVTEGGSAAYSEIAKLCRW